MYNLDLITKEFQIHQIPIRDWNQADIFLIQKPVKFQIHQIPIRDWNNSCLAFSKDRSVSNSPNPY